MSKSDQFDPRLKAYLHRGSSALRPVGMEERIVRGAPHRRTGWMLQIAAAAALFVLAVGLGIVIQHARQSVGVGPPPTPVATPSSTPTPSPTPAASGGPYPLLPPASLRMIDASIGWAAGSGTNRILRTADGGSHWVDVTPHSAQPGTWTTFFLDANNAWLASSLQPGSGSPDFSVHLYRTSDGGRSWPDAGTAMPDWGFPAALDFVDRQHGWLFMKQDGTLETPGSTTVALYGTTDGGASWNKLAQSDTSALAGHLPQACSKQTPVFLNTSQGWIQGGCGPGAGYFFYVTRDGGSNWAAVALPMPSGGTSSCDCGIGSLRFWDTQHGALVLDNAYQDARGYAQSFLYTTADGGRSWQLGPMLPTNASSAYFLDAAHGWTLDAKANKLLFTGDGGRHWSTAGTIPTNSNAVVMDFQFVSSETGWALGADSRGVPVLKTVDGGATWTIQLSP